LYYRFLTDSATGDVFAITDRNRFIFFARTYSMVLNSVAKSEHTIVGKPLTEF